MWQAWSFALLRLVVALAAGAAITTIGWRNVNLVSIPLLLAMLGAVLAWRRAAGGPTAAMR